MRLNHQQHNEKTGCSGINQMLKGLHALESSKSGGGASVVIPNVSRVPQTSSPTSGYLNGKK